MRSLAALLLLVQLCRPCAAASIREPYRLNLEHRFELGYSTSPARRFSFGYSAGTASIGVRAGIDDGIPLEMGVWGGAGAVIGSVVGPIGVMGGTAAGLVTGLLIGIFVVPHNGPKPGESRAVR